MEMYIPSLERRILLRLSAMALVVSFVFMAVSGCASPRIERAFDDRPVPGQGYRIKNFFAVDQLPADLRRVAVLPVFVGEDHVFDRDRFDELVESQLRRAGRFEIIVVDQSVLRNKTGRSQIAVSEQIPVSLVRHLQTKGVDGVFQLSITEFSPYRPFALGVHARLFPLGEPKAIWAVDELFSSSDQKVVNSARHYALSSQNKRPPYGDSYAALRGPFLFSKFVMRTIVQTIPPASGP
jgi:hypothetical protein